MNLTKSKIKKVNSLYIHIPFCSKICPYCDFVKIIDNEQFKKRYVDEIIKDISFLTANEAKFLTIYIGGGTPSVLNNEELIKLLSAIKPLLKDNYEFTIEVNPESLTIEKLKIFKEYGVNRISIGIQSFNKKILKEINRDFNIDYFKLINLVKKYISNINVDLIYGLPSQNLNILKEDLDNFIKLDINHISTYSLILEKGTEFYLKGVNEVSDEISREYYDYILNYLRSNGFKRYEVSNFAKPGFESRHNLTYRKDEEYLAIGIGASGYIDHYRYKNSASLTKYLKGERDKELEEISFNNDLEYYFICNLRLEDGFNLDEFKNKFHFDFLTKYNDKINKLMSRGLVKVNSGNFSCTDEGIALLDIVLRELI